MASALREALNGRRSLTTAEWQARETFCHSMPLSEPRRTNAIQCHSMPQKKRKKTKGQWLKAKMNF